MPSSSPGFLIIAVSKEFLKPAGTQPVVNEWLNRCVKNGTSMLATALSTGTGIGSRAEALSGRPAAALATSSGDNNENSVKDTPSETGLYVGEDDPDVATRIRSTLSKKKRDLKALKSSHRYGSRR